MMDRIAATVASAAAGWIGDMIFGKQQARIQDEASTQTLQMMQPYLSAGATGINALSALALGPEFAGRVGTTDPFLEAQHAENERLINRTERQSLGASSRYFGSRGNIGRGRGEAFRIEQGATEARNRENLAYGTAQRDYGLQMGNRYAGILGQLTGYGAQAAGIGARALQNRADAKSQVYDAAGAGLGDVLGAWQGGVEEEDYLRRQREALNPTDTTASRQAVLQEAAAFKPITLARNYQSKRPRYQSYLRGY